MTTVVVDTRHLFLALFVLSWVPLGAAVLAFIDKDGELLEWAKASPSSWLSGLVVVLWPVVVCAYLLLRHNEGDK